MDLSGTVDGPAREITVGDLVVGKSLTRSQFLASSASADAKVLVRNEPWCSWALLVELDGERWEVDLYFHDEVLRFVWLGGGFDTYGEPWAPETEAARQRHHDEALARWGMVGDDVRSGIDPKEGSAGVTITYVPHQAAAD